MAFEIPIGVTSDITLTGMTGNGSYLNAGTGNWTLYLTGNATANATGNFSYVAASDGNYTSPLYANVTANYTEGQLLTMFVNFQESSPTYVTLRRINCTAVYQEEE